MLQIYTKYNGDDLILSNDIEFNTVTLRRIFESGNTTYKELIEKIEGVKFISDDIFLSKINNLPVSITNLSTGCKTIINIIYNPDKVVCLAECGDNYSDYIYEMKDARLYMPYFMIPSRKKKFDNLDIELNHNNETMKFSDVYELGDWYYANIQ